MQSWKRKYCRPPKTEDIVLIGGIFDHKVITIDDEHNTYVRMQIINPNTNAEESEVYRIEHLLGRYEFNKIGVHEDYSLDEALKMLIEYYKEGEL
jgi:hypothetical protein